MKQEFITKVAEKVREYAPSYGIKVYSPIIAQAVLESGWGETKLAKIYHNYHGLKCGSKWTGKSVNLTTQEEYTVGTMTTIKDNFRVFDSFEDGIRGYFEFIQLPRYANLKGITDPLEYLQTLKNDGYATDSTYVEKNMRIIEQYNLTQYDRVESEETMTVDKVLAIARQEVGYLEKKNGDLKYLYDKTVNAGTANYTKYGYEMHKIYPSVMDYPASWCDCFVDWCFYMAYGTSNAKKLLGGNFDDYTPNSAQLYKNKGAYHRSNPQVGDQVFFNNGTRINHTGLVDEVTANGFYTIEGNTSSASGVVANGGCVRRKFYSFNYAKIDGFGRPAYAKLSFTPHWVNADGTWYYRVAEGQNAHGWRAINKHWYYFADDGRMLKGVQTINDKTYYLQESGDLEGALCRTDDSGQLVIWDL